MNEYELKTKISNINIAHDKLLPWKQYIQRLKYDILTKNPKNFFDFGIVQETMFCGNVDYTEIEYEELKDTPLFPFIKDETIFVKDRYRYRLDPTTIGNTIHHLYHLYQYSKYFNVNLTTINSVVEFGGGYGNMARIFKLINPNVKYELIDIPEVLLLQEYYLTNVGINCDNVSFNTHCETLNPDLFISTWSLSESPILIREEYLHLNCENFILAFGSDFETINNIEWFTKFITSYPYSKWIWYRNLPVCREVDSKQYDSYYILGNRHVIKT